MIATYFVIDCSNFELLIIVYDCIDHLNLFSFQMHGDMFHIFIYFTFGWWWTCIGPKYLPIEFKQIYEFDFIVHFYVKTRFVISTLYHFMIKSLIWNLNVNMKSIFYSPPKSYKLSAINQNPYDYCRVYSIMSKCGINQHAAISYLNNKLIYNSLLKLSKWSSITWTLYNYFE